MFKDLENKVCASTNSHGSIHPAARLKITQIQPNDF